MPPNDQGQAAFAAALLDPDAPVPDGIIRPDGRAAVKRFDVYRNNVTVSLTENLMAAYPVTVVAVGEDFFRAMARDFARAHPPRSPLMILYGAGFAEFIEGFGPARDIPYLADLARVDRAWLEAYHAADAEPAAPDALAAVPPDALADAALMLHPSVRILSLSHPALSIWSHIRAGRDGPLSLPPGGQEGMAVRPGMQVGIHLMPPGSAAFLAALASGAPLGTAVEAAPEGFELGQALTVLLQGGALTAIRTS